MAYPLDTPMDLAPEACLRAQVAILVPRWRKRMQSFPTARMANDLKKNNSAAWWYLRN